ncbi:MAG: hypothetical protein IAF00_04010 [Phycisphaerales bacterium]|nr:hypothetical protein [Phycisphaerales bacterium]
MSERQRAQYTMYTTEAAIPAYQRAWIWGTVALVILLCGIAIGWLASDLLPRHQPDIALNEPSSIGEAATLLDRQQVINEQLRARIAQVEQALAGDVCGPVALEALTQDRPK